MYISPDGQISRHTLNSATLCAYSSWMKSTSLQMYNSPGTHHANYQGQPLEHWKRLLSNCQEVKVRMSHTRDKIPTGKLCFKALPTPKLVLCRRPISLHNSVRFKQTWSSAGTIWSRTLQPSSSPPPFYHNKQAQLIPWYSLSFSYYQRATTSHLYMGDLQWNK